MSVFICVDEKMGLLFREKRLSRDRQVIHDIVEIAVPSLASGGERGNTLHPGDSRPRGASGQFGLQTPFAGVERRARERPLLNNGGNLLNTPYSMAVFTSYLATFLLANSGFCSIFYTFASLIRIS